MRTNHATIQKVFAAALAFVVTFTPFSFGGVGAESPANPFFDEPDALRIAYGTEMADVRLHAVAAVIGDEDPDEFEEALEDVLESDLPLFAGSLEAQDPKLLQDLEETVEKALEAAETGRVVPLETRVERARALVQLAQERLLPAELREEPAFVSALMNTLLLSEAGIGEAFEEAVEGETEEFPRGWAALQHVKSMWQDVVRPIAPERNQFEIDSTLSTLDDLFPNPEPPASFIADPEEAESPSHQIVGLLEGATGAELYPDRDLGRLVSFVYDMAAEACGSFDKGNALLGRERALWAGFYYEEYLADPVGLFAPAQAEAIEEALEQLGEEEGARTAGTHCGELLSQLDEVRSVFGG